jgi:transcriptional regulator of arginine metabolism
MSEGRLQRQRALAQLLRSGAAASQEELVEALRTRGFSVTQATVSRDLDQLGAARMRRDGAVRYGLPDDDGGTRAAQAAANRLAAIARDWIRSAVAAGQLTVIRTPAGSAHLVGVALDGAALPGIVGTICGDDTVFVAAADHQTAESLARKLRDLAGLGR